MTSDKRRNEDGTMNITNGTNQRSSVLPVYRYD